MARSSLEVASLLYLALPWFIFAVGRLRWPWAACVVVAASNGRILLADGDGEIALAYGFELQHPLRAATLAVRCRTARPTALAVAIDGSPPFELPLRADAGQWRFADAPIGMPLTAGWHELTVRTQAPGIEIDAFMLIEAAR